MKYLPGSLGALAVLAVFLITPHVSADSPAPTIEVDLEEIVSLSIEDATVREALEEIGAGLQFVYDEKTDQASRTSFSIKNVSRIDALRFFLRSNRMFHVARDANTFLIAPDTRQKRQEHMPRDIRTFELEHADGKNVVTVLRSILQSRKIFLDERRNAVTLEDELGKLDLAEEIVARLDREHGRAPVGNRETPLWFGSGYDQYLRVPGASIPTLEVDMDRMVDTDLTGKSLGEIHDTLGEATGVQILLDAGIDRGQQPSVEFSAMSASDLLDRVNESLDLFSVVWGPDILFVAQDTQGRQWAEELHGIQFFYLEHANTKDVITALRSLIQVRQVAEVVRLNAVVLKDNVQGIEAAVNIVADMDLPASDSASNR